MPTILIRAKLTSLIIAIISIVGTGCTSIKTLPSNQITTMLNKRDVARVHFNDSLLVLSRYEIRDNILTGQVASNPVKIKSGHVIDFYLAPSGAMRLNGQTLSVPLENVGKIDYPRPEPLHIITPVTAGIVITFLIILMSAY
jgi:hypothetical protein